MGTVLVLPDYKINNDDPGKTPVHKETRKCDNGDQDQYEHVATIPEGEDKWGRDNNISKITDVNQKEMLQWNWMLPTLPF
jgi:hypothetical protein